MHAIARGALPADLRAVVCNEPGAPGIALAQEAGYEVAIVHHRDFSARDRFDAALAETIDRFDPQLVVLAGFMRILTPGFVRRYAGRLINIHPSLLPAFPGPDTHARAIAAGAGVHGATVHFVTGKLDRGPIIAQARVPVLAGTTPTPSRRGCWSASTSSCRAPSSGSRNGGSGWRVTAFSSTASLPGLTPRRHWPDHPPIRAGRAPEPSSRRMCRPKRGEPR